ncbi:MAG TPA: hypothetical protein VNO30_03175 [Kofleriaceae bacterium]|nr:hypothetical protein [Kofleriaceae bacterium]
MPERAGEPGGRAAEVVLAAAALAPWLVLAPLAGAAAVAAHALALTAAFHGAGVGIGRLARRPGAHPLLAVQWGAAALVGLFGIAIAAGVGGLVTQSVLLYGAVAAHTGAIALRWRGYRARLAAARPGLGVWLVPWGLLAGIAVLHVLGAAGDLDAPPFDDDGHVPAQLARLRETGALGDPIGYARHAQLGGQLALGALATLGGDVHLARLAEGLAFVLALALALARLRTPGERDAARALWGTLLVLAGSAQSYVRPDPATLWTAIGLILALHATLADRRAGDSPLPIAVLAGALITLRLELAPVAVAAIAAAWWPDRRDLRRAALLAAGVLAVIAPYLLARAGAGAAVPAAARALLESRLPPLGARLAIFAAVAVACAPLAAIFRGRPLGWLAAGAALTIAGVASQLTGERPYAAGFLWPLAIAAAIAGVIQLGRARRTTAAALLVSLAVVVFIYEGRTTGGRRRWVRRYIDLGFDMDYLRTTRGAAPVSGGYEALLRPLPARATVAVWVLRPERLPYGAGPRIIDLRTPRAGWLGSAPWAPYAPYLAPLEAFLARVGADYLLVEEAAPGLRAVAQSHAVIAEAAGVQLIDLRAAPRVTP